MSLHGEEEDLEWEPPTEAEMKLIQARRERQDQISKIMGDYLLKGYKMLGECCDVCGTILLQDRTHKNYCVSCQELDSDVDKDNPALNAQAALSQVRERRLAAQSPAPSDPAYVNGDAGGRVAAVPQPRPDAALRPLAQRPVLQDAEEAVLSKMRWASSQLQTCASLESSIQLCNLISSCAASLRSLREIGQ
uniref:Zinc ribbon domain containing 2 n=1 Tax=Hippocampus comes TaxID=109280 RepID=A0A3Q2XQJ7_HIPCM